MNNKVKFLRGTSAEYEASTKDNDTFYYTTDTKKLYLGETEITGIEIDDSSTTATDKTWSAKKISDSIPTSLPANGGNAATVNGKKINWNIYSNPTQFGKALTDTANDIWLALPNQSMFIIEIRLLTDSSWNFPSDEDTRFHTLVMMKYMSARPAGIYLYPKSSGSIYYALVDASSNFASKWYKINDGGNADTVNNHTVESDVPANAKFTDTVYTHPTSGVTAGTYKSVTVDNKGHVTAGSNPTTLAGYGITDAAAKSHTHDDRYYTESEINTKLNTKLNTSLKGTASGLAELDSNGKVPSSQLPSYVDDVLEYDKLASFPSTGETGKIYVAIDTNKTYRWSGSAYIEISPSLALGETSSTAYRGDRGKVAYDHSQTPHAPSNAEANVQSDWSVTDTSSDAYIKNKPTSLPANGGTATKANTLSTARTIDGMSFNGSANITHYASCSTAAATAAKVVSLTGFTLATGAKIAIKFTVTNTAANPTLNVNNTGAKAIYYRGAAISAGYLAANRTYEFVYNGTQYELVGDLDTNIDTKVTQNNSTANAAYRVLLSPNANDTAETNTVVKSANFIANPSTGAFYAAGYDRVDITTKTLDLDTLTLSSGHPLSAFYICRSSGGANNITNLPTAAMAFLLNVELIRWVSSADYLTIQTLISFADPSVQHFRYCKNGTWTGWEKRINHDEQWLDVCDIDSSDCENLKYIDSTGAVISSQEYAVSGYIPINNNDIVYGAANNVDAGIPCIALYDASKTFITALSCQNVRSHGSWRIAINNFAARYMRVNYYGTSTTSTASAKSLLPPSQQFLIIRRNANENSDIKITVDGTASTENIFTYKTFFKGLQVAYAIRNCYLDVKPSSSDYNIGTEMGGAFYSWGTFSTISSTVAYGGWIGHNITVEFEQGAKVIATNSNSKNVGQMFSILNVSDSFKLINANLEVTNCRYCVHEDRWILGDIPSYYTAEYINCIMKNNGATSAIGWNASCCIGAGTTKGSNSIIRGGYYESPSAFPYPISYHNSTSSASKDEKVTIENVILAGGNKLRMHNLYKTGSIVNVYLIGNYTTSPIFVEATDGISDRFVVHGDGDGKVPIYSVNEFLTGEIWINGKPIYGKYYETNFGSDTAAWTVGTISGFDEIIDVRGWGVFGSAAGNISYWGEHYTTDAKGTNSLYFQVNSKGNIVCTSLNPYNYSTNNDAKVRVIIKYTKT